MPELRKDYILDRYVIIASERGKRPHVVEGADEKVGSHCFFCPGNEHETPPEVYRLGDDKKWKIRVFPNKFPAVAESGKIDITTDNEFFTYADAVGRHEVLVETPDHDRQLADLDEDEILDVMRTYVLRKRALMEIQGVRYVAMFKNSGEEAGCSIAHSHSQIIAYNNVPTIICQKESAVREHAGCPYCRVLQVEKNSDRRIYEDSHVVAFAPYASRFPYEAWVLPKRHVVDPAELKEPELAGFSQALKKLLSTLKEFNTAYNYYFQYGTSDMHLHLELTPRFSKVKWAGFEMTTGTVINTVPPESAALHYRGEQQ